MTRAPRIARPTPADIAAAVAKVEAMDVDERGRVQSPFNVSDHNKPAHVDFSNARLKIVKLTTLMVGKNNTKVRLDNLIWHIEHPGQSKFNEIAPQVVHWGDEHILVNGHHRLAALVLLGRTQAAVFHAKQVGGVVPGPVRNAN